ncbi:hypothetical protein K1719_026123 [Acacia pycnantha]|nr:hypothetical protein K1719_026123 [Acacia pycnantha]
MAKLIGFHAFITFLLLLSMLLSLSETRLLKNELPSSLHFHVRSHFISGSTKQYLGFERRSLLIMNSSDNDEVEKVKRNGNYAPPRTQRVSPGGPDEHHHKRLNKTR